MPAPNATRHDSFTLTRHLDAAPAAVFAVFADTELWRKWFRMPGSAVTCQHDFRVGGADLTQSAFTHPDGRVERLANRAVYFHIEPDHRVVYAYEAIVDDVPRWASLVTVELHPDGNETGRGAGATKAGTQMTWTEQVAFITPSGDGRDDLPHLRGGLQLRFNALAAVLDAMAGSAAG
jgi:uncharacterized protein YndB with AHSA1/START domain